MLHDAVNRLGDVLVRHALSTTANYLEDHSAQTIDRWAERLESLIPSYSNLIPEMRQWGSSTLALLVDLLRARRLEDRIKIEAHLDRLGREMASTHLEMAMPLQAILRSSSLFRLTVLSTVEQMLRSRLWTAFPHDILRAAEMINEALDHQMLLTSESYLAERDRTIARSQGELEATNRQLMVLVQEMHHRIKNNLQTIADLLTLEIHSGRDSSTEVVLRESITRVRSIAAVHELLSAENVREADIKELAEIILSSCVRTMAGRSGPVGKAVQGRTVLLPSKQATAMAVVMTELINNALEHGFDGNGGTILLTVGEDSGMVTVSVADSGRGLPPDFDVETSAKLGLQIVRTLVTKDLGGTLELSSNGGTTATVRFAK